jgi:DegV family protein with EDD domain
VPGVAVVTDSTADLPYDLAEQEGIRVVPLSVAFGTEVLMSGVTIDPTTFYTRLADASGLPTTSQPAPAWFEEAYADCFDDGLEAAVSVHCSGALSGTVAVARDRAVKAPLRIEVVDSGLVGSALGLAVLAGHRVASDGGTVEEVVAAVQQVKAGCTTLLVVDTLDYLKRGGRLTGAQAMVGRALQVKPLLHVSAGRVEIRERSRTWTRAIDRLIAIAAEQASGRPVDVVVSHAVASERAADVWERLAGAVDIAGRLETVIGPIVGTHVGRGAVGVSLIPAEATPVGTLPGG